MAATTEYLDLSDAVFTVSGATKADDLFNSDTALFFDGINDVSTSSEEPFTASSGSKHSMTALIINDGGTSDAQIIMNMRTMVAGTNAVMSFIIDASQFLEANWMSNGTTDRVKSASVDISSTLLNNVRHHVGATVNGNVCKIYIDGIEQAYSTENQVSGGGFTGVKSGSLTPLTVGDDINTTHPFDGTVERLKFFEGETLSDAAMLTEALAELAGPLSSPRGGYGRPSFRLDFLRQTRYNRGLTRSNR